MTLTANIVTRTEYGDEPDCHWHRAKWVTLSPGVRKIRYETDFDLTILMRNLAVAGGLALARKMGLEERSCVHAGREVRKDGP